MRYKKKFNVNLKIVKSMLFDSFEQRRVLKDSFELHRFYYFKLTLSNYTTQGL